MRNQKWLRIVTRLASDACTLVNLRQHDAASVRGLALAKSEMASQNDATRRLPLAASLSVNGGASSPVCFLNVTKIVIKS